MFMQINYIYDDCVEKIQALTKWGGGAFGFKFKN